MYTNMDTSSRKCNLKCNCDREKCIISTVVVCICLILAGFWCSIIAIYDNGVKERLSIGDMPSIDKNMSYFELEKGLGFNDLFWRWSYEADKNNNKYEAKQACVSLQHDVLLYQNGELTYSSNGKILSVTSNIEIYDRNENKKFLITTGSFWITLINQNRILVNFNLQDTAGNNILYVDSVNAWNLVKEYYFKDANGTTVAYAIKDITTFPWTWKTTLYDYNASKFDFRLLMIVFAHSSFSEGSGSKGSGSDACNNYFLYVSIIDGICTLIFIIVMGWIFFEEIKLCCKYLKEKFRR